MGQSQRDVFFLGDGSYLSKINDQRRRSTLTLFANEGNHFYQSLLYLHQRLGQEGQETVSSVYSAFLLIDWTG